MSHALRLALCSLILGTGFPLVAGDPAGKKEIRFMIWGSAEEVSAVNRYLERFQKQYPEIPVKVIHSPSFGYREKLSLMISGGDVPDVFYLDVHDFLPMVQKDTLLDLDPLLKKNPDFPLQNFYPELLDKFKRDGKQFGIPKDFATLVLYYNADLFDAYEVPYPREGWTWDDFLAAARKLTRDENGDGRPETWGFVLETWFGEWAPWVWQNGGEIMNPDATQWVLGKEPYLASNAEALQFLSDLVWKHKVAPPPTVTKDQGTSNLFLTGKVAMCTYGRWICLEFKKIKNFSWDLAPLPKKKQEASSLFTVAYAIARNSPHPEEAWKLVSFLTGSAGQEETAQSGQAIPSLRAVAESPAFLAPRALGEKPRHHEFNLKAVGVARPAPLTPRWREVDSYVTKQLEGFWNKPGDARQAILELQPVVEKVLSEKK